MKWRTLLAAGLLAFAALYPQLGSWLPPLIAPAPPVPAAPSAELQAIVAPLRAKLSGHSERKRIATFFVECAAELRSNAQLKTLAQVRTFNDKASAAMVRRVGPLEGLGTLLNQSLQAVAGNDPATLDAAQRERLAQWYDAVAWAAGG